jgi:16S rRNA (guanine527-N7)-methyltransferase
VAGGSVHQRLCDAAAAVRIALGDAEASRLARYAELLLAWGARINLTGARTAAELVDDHLADAFAVATAIPASAERLVDVGAGAGLPGIVLAILNPELECTLLEPRQKRWAFLQEARRELRIGNLSPLCVRLEEHLEAHDFRPYDVAVSRATWPVEEWLARGSALVDRGTVLALEGRNGGPLPKGALRTPYDLPFRAGAIVSWRRSLS